jgi:hypothetical protein
MKSATRFVLIYSLLAAVAAGTAGGPAGCGGGGLPSDRRTVADCAGRYSGAYGGTITGTLSGTLTADGNFTVTFVQAGSPLPISGTSKVGPDGKVQFVIAGNTIDGVLNFDTCAATGTWQFGGAASGGWQMTLMQ